MSKGMAAHTHEHRMSCVNILSCRHRWQLTDCNIGMTLCCARDNRTISPSDKYCGRPILAATRPIKSHIRSHSCSAALRAQAPADAAASAAVCPAAGLALAAAASVPSTVSTDAKRLPLQSPLPYHPMTGAAVATVTLVPSTASAVEFVTVHCVGRRVPSGVATTPCCVRTSSGWRAALPARTAEIPPSFAAIGMLQRAFQHFDDPLLRAHQQRSARRLACKTTNTKKVV